MKISDEEILIISSNLEELGYERQTILSVLLPLVAKQIDPRFLLAITAIKLSYKLYKKYFSSTARICNVYPPGFKQELCKSNMEIFVLSTRIDELVKMKWKDSSDILTKKINIQKNKLDLLKEKQKKLVEEYIDKEGKK